MVNHRVTVIASLCLLSLLRFLNFLNLFKDPGFIDFSLLLFDFQFCFVFLIFVKFPTLFFVCLFSIYFY